MAAHPSWPQREIAVEKGLAVLLIGAGDSQEYVDWASRVSEQYDGQVRWAYVPKPGGPSVADLTAIKEQVSGDLQKVDAAPAYSVAWIK
ncbi:hypothetical protein GCM10028802_04130 [Terrabacter terrigena]